MMRKYGSRFDWKRVVERRYSEMFFEDECFKGYVTLLQLIKVTESLDVTYGTTPVRIADNGYYWMQHFPERGHYTVTTMIDSDGKVVQWYIDICKCVGYSKDKGPWMDDWILDIVVLPNGQMVELDVDEFEDARSQNTLPLEELEQAWNEFIRLKEAIQSRKFTLLAKTLNHFEEIKKESPPVMN